jgi:glyoxylase-like metal-dependent hydrolase (beta-lactamase superfamily II)
VTALADITYDIIVRGNNLRLRDGFLAMSNVTLVKTGRGYLLFDTAGYISRLGLITALRERNIAPGDIKMVFLSHLHFDHCHNIDLFPKAKVFVSKSEWSYAKSPHHEDIFMPWGIHEMLERYDLEILEGEGVIDPGVSFFPAPGHTPGSFAVRLDTKERGCVVIAGDAIKYAKEVIMQRGDNVYDTLAASTASIRRITEMADRIIPGHFPELIKQPNGQFGWTEGAAFDLIVR